MGLREDTHVSFYDKPCPRLRWWSACGFGFPAWAHVAGTGKPSHSSQVASRRPGWLLVPWARLVTAAYKLQTSRDAGRGEPGRSVAGASSRRRSSGLRAAIAVPNILV